MAALIWAAVFLLTGIAVVLIKRREESESFHKYLENLRIDEEKEAWIKAAEATRKAQVEKIRREKEAHVEFLRREREERMVLLRDLAE